MSTEPILPATQLAERLVLAEQRIDPGSRRLIHAIKTLLAVVAAMGLFWRSDVQTRLFAAVGAAFLMQCVGCGSRRYQHLCMLVSGVAMTLLVLIGAGLGTHRHAQYVLLAFLAFLIFHVRRWLPDHPAFPLFGFTLCVLATALPSGWDIAQREAMAVGISLLVAFPIYFLVAHLPDYPVPGVRPGPRTPLRAAVAALLAILIAEAFELPRAYWAIMVAVILVAETARESLRRGTERVAMTILGCLLGWLLHAVSAPSAHAQQGLMLVCVFLAVFFRNASVPWMVFFITVYVVFLFAVTGRWDARILLVRCYETAIGGTVSLVATLLLPAETENDGGHIGQEPADGTPLANSSPETASTYPA